MPDNQQAMSAKSKTSAKSGKRAKKDPDIRLEHGRRLPAVDVRTPLVYYRLPMRLRSPNTTDAYVDRDRLYQPEYDEAFSTVQQDWWSRVPSEMAERYLTSAFSGRPLITQSGLGGRWLTVSSIGTPSGWTPAQREAWSKFESALVKSIPDAEKRYQKEVERRVLARRKAEKERAEAERRAERRRAAERRAAERAEAERLRAAKRKAAEREAAEREAALIEAADRIRREEREKLVHEGEVEYWVHQGIPKSMVPWIDPDPVARAAAQQFAEEYAALRGAFAGPSEAPEVQSHLRKLKQAASRQRSDQRFAKVEVDLLPPAQAAREQLARTLRQQVRVATSTEDRRKLYARLRRVESALLRKGTEREREVWQQQQSREEGALAARMALISPYESVRNPSRVSPSRVSPSRVSPSRVSPSRVSPSDSRSIAERIASPRGRYVSPDASAPPVATIPREVADRIDEEAHMRALAMLGPEPQVEDGDYNPTKCRLWNVRFREERDRIRAELRAEALEQQASELAETAERDRLRDQRDSRFADLEID